MIEADSTCEEKTPVCLTIGGSDSCGGAGIQADLRVFEALGVHGCSAITALTAQNPSHISRIEPVSLAQFDAECHAVFDYYDVVAVKTGMLWDVEHIAVLSAVLHERHQGYLVVDPVLLSSSGKTLLPDSAIDTLMRALLPMATLITPNLDEAAVLLGEPVNDAEQAGRLLLERCAQYSNSSVLLKGGHADADSLVDILYTDDAHMHRFTHPHQSWSLQQRHGTGCRLASAITANLAQQQPLTLAVENAITYLQESCMLS